MEFLVINAYDSMAAEIDIFIAGLEKEEDYKLKYVTNGWLKPHKQLKLFCHHSKITYNLPRGRVREKKQIFLRAA
jgi:hypothetical protein